MGAAVPPVISSRGWIWAAALTGRRRGGGDGERLPQQRCGGRAGPVAGDAQVLDFAGVVDLRGVDRSGEHFQAAPEFQLLVGQQFPERAVPNVPDRGERRFDERVRIVDVSESGGVHTKYILRHTDSHPRNQTIPSFLERPDTLRGSNWPVW